MAGSKTGAQDEERQDGWEEGGKSMSDTQSHWQNVWATRLPEEVGWFEMEPAT
jgi:hypothetical protein